MAFSTPKTWSAALVTVADMNTYIRDNQIALKDPPTDSYDVNEVADYTTTSATFVDVDATDLALTITTTGGDVLVHFHGTTIHSSTNARFFDVDMDGARLGGDDGFLNIGGSDDAIPASFTRLVTGLSAGSHTFKLQWRTSAGTLTMYAGAGTSAGDVHPQFWVREVS